MSLKAKLEAVIYAAEEPVTLAQLAALFAADALEWKAEQEAASAESRRRDAVRRAAELPCRLRAGLSWSLDSADPRIGPPLRRMRTVR